MKKLVVITGPTAVGKSDLSIKLAKEINGEVISADSIQVYKGLDIGSAKITEEEMDNIPHHLIDILEPDEEFNVHLFKELTLKAMNEIYAKGKIPIIVGGTGFYIQAVLYDIKFDDTDIDYEYRKELEDLAREKGNEYLHNMLRDVDPKSANNIHYNNLKRVIRALEFFKINNRSIADHNEEQWENISPYNFAYFVLNDDRAKLYDRIDKRVDVMVENGLVDEVKGLKDKGYTKDLLSMSGIGYKEVFDYLEGHINLEDSIELIKKNSRHFAKRQLTWFRREKTTEFININEFDYNKDLILKEVLKSLEEKDII